MKAVSLIPRKETGLTAKVAGYKGLQRKADKVDTLDNNTSMLDYLRPCTIKSAEKSVSEVLTQKIHDEFGDFFSGSGYFEGTFSLQTKDGSQLYQAPPRRVAYTLQQSLKEELDRSQRQQIIFPLGVDETCKCCNSFVLAQWQIAK